MLTLHGVSIILVHMSRKHGKLTAGVKSNLVVVDASMANSDGTRTMNVVEQLWGLEQWRICHYNIEDKRVFAKLPFQ